MLPIIKTFDLIHSYKIPLAFIGTASLIRIMHNYTIMWLLLYTICSEQSLIKSLRRMLRRRLYEQRQPWLSN